MIELRKITWDNWEECIDLEITDEQDNFMASNKYSLAQAYVAMLNDKRPPMTFAIYHNEIMVGFTMFYYQDHEENDGSDYEEKPCYTLLRFMIDKKYQGQGLGKQAMAKILEYIKTFPHGRAACAHLSYDPKNEAARKLYKSFGFVETGELTDDGEDAEVVAKLTLTEEK